MESASILKASAVAYDEVELKKKTWSFFPFWTQIW